MNTIGLRINKTLEGVQPLLTLPSEGGDWTRKVSDVRDILKLYDTTDTSGFAMFMSFSKTGAYITIARAISGGRSGDNVAAWLYIPNNIEVDGGELCTLIEEVKVQLSLPSLEEDKLKRVLAQSYPETTAAKYMTYDGVMRAYAKRDVGFYSLKQIVTKRYQQYYKDYAAILLVTDNSFPVVAPIVKDLTMKTLEESIVFCPPKNLPKGVDIYLDDAGKLSPFTSPIRVIKGLTLNLQLKREKFVPIYFKDTASENSQECKVPSTLEWYHEVSYGDFKVVSMKDGTDITNRANITLNDKSLRWNEKVRVPEDKFQKSVVRVQVPGYENEEQVINLKQRPVTIKLHRETKEKKWEVTLRNGGKGIIIIRSKGLPPGGDESPLKGYSDWGHGELVYTGYDIWRQRFYGFLAAIAVFLIVMICAAINNWYESHTFKWQLGWPPLKIESFHNSPQGEYTYNTNPGIEDATETLAESSLDKAMAYLDNNDAWNRDSLIQYSELQGLFEELNSYDFDKLKDRQTTLRKSTRYNDLLIAIDKNSYKEYSSNYNKEGDYVITISDYISKLNRTSDATSPTANEEIKNAVEGNNTESAAKDSQSKNENKNLN